MLEAASKLRRAEGELGAARGRQVALREQVQRVQVERSRLKQRARAKVTQMQEEMERLLSERQTLLRQLAQCNQQSTEVGRRRECAVAAAVAMAAASAGQQGMQCAERPAEDCGQGRERPHMFDGQGAGQVSGGLGERVDGMLGGQAQGEQGLLSQLLEQAEDVEAQAWCEELKRRLAAVEAGIERLCAACGANSNNGASAACHGTGGKQTQPSEQLPLDANLHVAGDAAQSGWALMGCEAGLLQRLDALMSQLKGKQGPLEVHVQRCEMAVRAAVAAKQQCGRNAPLLPPAALRCVLLHVVDALAMPASSSSTVRGGADSSITSNANDSLV